LAPATQYQGLRELQQFWLTMLLLTIFSLLFFSLFFLTQEKNVDSYIYKKELP